MNSFFDSNIVIGYIFCLDSSFKVSNELIFRSRNKYYSINVRNEVNSVFSRKSLEFKKFFSKLNGKISHMDDFCIVSRDEFHRIIENFGDIGKFDLGNMHESFEIIWDLFDFGENQEIMIIKLKFDNFINNFESFNRLRKQRIFNEMILVPNHTKKDSKILEKIEEMNLREGLLHSGDEEILFDVNEFLKDNRELDIKFVTGDQDFIKAIDILMEFLCLDECINIMEFSNC
ncbi:hypothetical protein [Methanobrevibacter sp.]